MYALGVTLYVMLHGFYPFYHQDNKTLYNMIWHDVSNALSLSLSCVVVVDTSIANSSLARSPLDTAC